MQKLATVKEVADLLQVSESWVYTRIRKGEIPYKKLAGSIRFDWSEIEAWLDDSSQRDGEDRPSA